MNEHILLAYSLDGLDGKEDAQALIGEQISQHIKDDILAWVHLDANHQQTRKWLQREVSYLDPFIIEALLAAETRPRITQIGDGAIIILRGANLNKNADPEDMISIRLWVDKHRIISVQRRTLKAVHDIEEKILAGKGPKDAGQFVCMLSSRLFERMESVLSDLDEATDAIEEEILDNAKVSLRQPIISVRKKAIIFRRYIAPQRDAISQLCLSDIDWIDKHHKRHLQEVFNHVTRYVEDLDAIRERALVIKDELANMLADQMNKNMYVLSVIAAIFLPLGFLTGLLGINVGGIPGADNTDAFWMFLAILSVTVLLQIVIFKKFKWF